MKPTLRLSAICCFYLFIQMVAKGETVGVFFDPDNAQINFAANDVKSALEKKNIKAEMLDLASLDAGYSKKKIVISLGSKKSATNLLTAQGGKTVTGLGEQAYSFSTTTTPQKSYWVFGGDANGAMYGGLQIAENIGFDGMTGVYNSTASPVILKRGIKLNLPWDKNSATYGRFDKGTFDGTSAQLAIRDVWDMTFWTGWFDEMARNRYNVLSIWSCNPFSSLVVVPGYEDCSIENVTLFDGTVKPMTIARKIKFWQDVMAYADSRGFDFLIFNWNVFTYGVSGKHGISDGRKGASDPDTLDYMYKAMTQLLETYPHLDGFGMSVGENGGTEDYAWNAYGKAMYDYAKANPERRLKFIHRLHFGDFEHMMKLFSPLNTLPNAGFEISVKHSKAHMYSTPVPRWCDKEYDKIRSSHLKTWLTVRNDSFYYHTWGDPDFARAYIKGMLDLGDIYKGFYMGSDGYNPTRTFFCKEKSMNGQLEVTRQQYMMMLWGRLSYDPELPDETFINYLQQKYPSVSGGELFKAWRQSSRGLQSANEMIHRTFDLDFKWWPEACQRDTRLSKPGTTDFVTISEFAQAGVAPGSSLAGIADSAHGKLKGRKCSYAVADGMEAGALSSLAILKAMKAPTNTELGMAIGNIKTMSYLTLYYANKIRGAAFLTANERDKAKKAMGDAYAWWIHYAKLMDEMYTGMDMQRSVSLPNWRCRDSLVLKEYTDLGGVGIPVIEEIIK